MQRLGGTDSLFLSMETDEVHGHVGGLILLDPSESDRFGFERLRTTLIERLPLAGEEFQCRLREVPLGLARPYWEADPDFDVGNHLRRKLEDPRQASAQPIAGPQDEARVVEAAIGPLAPREVHAEHG